MCSPTKPSVEKGRMISGRIPRPATAFPRDRLHWTYDCDEQRYIWNAKEKDAAILKALSEL